MKTFKLILFFLIFILLSNFSQAQDEISNCMLHFRVFGSKLGPWAIDKDGSNGYRTLMYLRFNNECYTCTFEGYKWAEVEKRLGIPNEEFLKEDKIIKRYYCNEVNKFETGYLLLDVIVNSEGEVVGTKFFKVPAD